MSNAFRKGKFKLLTSVGKTSVWQLKNAPAQAAFFFESGVTIDADGARTAYGPKGTANTLDDLGNAGHAAKPAQPATAGKKAIPAQKANWWGVVTDNRKKTGNPIQQKGDPGGVPIYPKPSQPEKGFFISPTGLQDIAFYEDDVRRYVDSTKVAYIAIPTGKKLFSQYFPHTGVKYGDTVLLINALNGKFCFAIIADSKGDKPVVGEISIRAAELLAIPSDARHGGQASGVIHLVFPNSGLGQGMGAPDEHTMRVTGKMALEHFSRFRDPEDRLITAFPEFPSFAKALRNAGYLTN